MPRNRNKTKRVRKTVSKRNKRVSKQGGSCGCGKLFQGGYSVIPLNPNDNLAYNTVSTRNLKGGKRSKTVKSKGGSIMSMFNSVSNGVTGASNNSIFSFGTIPGAAMSKSVLYGVPLNNPSSWVQPVKNVYSNDNVPLV